MLHVPLFATASTFTDYFDISKGQCFNLTGQNVCPLYLEGHFVYLFGVKNRYTYRVLQKIQMKLIILCVWAERVVLGSAKTASKFIHEI